MLSNVCVVLCALFLTGHCHVRLTWPPAREYDFDFMDNIRTKGPCGMNRGLGSPTMLKGGGSLDVSWHLGYPHGGGIRLEILNNLGNVSHTLTPANWTLTNDTTKQSQTVTIPNIVCSDCSLRLLRQAKEWGKSYTFWSCADVDIRATGNYQESCSSRGAWMNGACQCNYMYHGDKCQYKNECEMSSDCGGNGYCYDTMATTYPKKQCYCRKGWMGQQCNQATNWATIDVSSGYKTTEFAGKDPKYTMYHKINNGNEIEVVLKVHGTSWAAVGWRPSGTTGSCQGSFPLFAASTLIGAATPNADALTTETNNAKALFTAMDAETTTQAPSAVTAGSTLVTGEYRNPANCAGSVCNYVATWSYDQSTDDITFTVEGKTSGWVAIGFSEDTNMANSDVVLGGLAAGTADVSDMTIGSSRSQPSVDTTQNIQAATATQSGGMTKITFKRKRSTGDAADKEFTNAKCLYLLFAYGGTFTNSGSFTVHTGKFVSAAPVCFKQTSGGDTTAETTAEPEPTAEPMTCDPDKRKAWVSPGSEPEPGTGEPATEEPAKEGAGEEEAAEEEGGGRIHPMDCTDMIIGSAHGDFHRVRDYYTRDRSTPRMDTMWPGGADSLTSVTGYEKDGYTWIGFKRPLTSAEKTDHKIVNALMNVIWARGQEYCYYHHSPSITLANSTEPHFYKKDELKYHGHGSQRGTFSMNLMDMTTPVQDEAMCRGEFKTPSTCSDLDCTYKATWTLEGENIKFTMKAKDSTDKWVGIGFSQDKFMPASDVVVGWSSASGQYYVGDRWAAGRTMPVADTTDSLTEKSGTNVNGVTTISFTRKRDTGDTQDLAFTNTQCLYMLHAIGGGYNHTAKTFAYHASKMISAEKICIKPCVAAASDHVSACLMALFTIQLVVKLF